MRPRYNKKCDLKPRFKEVSVVFDERPDARDYRTASTNDTLEPEYGRKYYNQPPYCKKRPKVDYRQSKFDKKPSDSRYSKFNNKQDFRGPVKYN